jgi:hypothetical protein
VLINRRCARPGGSVFTRMALVPRWRGVRLRPQSILCRSRYLFRPLGPSSSARAMRRNCVEARFIQPLLKTGSIPAVDVVFVATVVDHRYGKIWLGLDDADAGNGFFGYAKYLAVWCINGRVGASIND